MAGHVGCIEHFHISTGCVSAEVGKTVVDDSLSFNSTVHPEVYLEDSDIHTF